ncbi:Endoglucanase 11 [Ananas comosus]|uniref:Endoglucanase n=1 Tax=Ananas comosus TaxID=4615 RepID=A0A199UNF7_ANACO|nr:Endoglucanase 11 [Ananas comosus]
MREEQGRGSWNCRNSLLSRAVLVFAILSSVVSSTSAAVFDYKDALSKSLLYFEAQRSGRLPHNQRIAWRDHSGLTDGLQQGVDLVGGYYDAGDHVKFGLPMAFTVTMLSWSAIEYGDEIAAAGEYQHVSEAIKWGTDYFIKAHTHPYVLWAEVGDGDTDHYCWQRPEDMTTSRQAFKIDEENPGSDLAGETAAAMAAASIVFKKSNPHYSHLLLHHALQLFQFGDKYRGKYDRSVEAARSYYASVSGYMDELLWAALWLHRATGREEYLAYAMDNADDFGGIGWAITEFSWDVKYAGLQVLAAKLLLKGEHSEKHKSTLEQYKEKADYYICACLGKNNGRNVDRSPGGMLFIRQWNNLQYVSGASFLLSVYSDYLANARQELQCPDGPVTPTELLALAKSQADYILGSNPMALSYLVGYGPKYPINVHHRGASIVSYKENKGFIGCTQGYDDWFGRQGPNPNVLVGAIVGGPNRRDRFRDERGNYMQTEACTYNTAPMVGVFAKLHRLASGEIQQVSSRTSSASLASQKIRQMSSRTPSTLLTSQEIQQVSSRTSSASRKL